ncbi:hypothetical protein [Chondromyces apiculatus]|uniref:Uncharacterized protein n=1 Tax=Chondromyces apiculatus DSM 436 TaxID=1192034 RepID=A0A017ST62_9BACT|nr:hypothetical protein [Chondromyces apiculatus]EYF00178.1 Hypothetical protein CAP_1113 [Chondromyces apiculatus DSM 436]
MSHAYRCCDPDRKKLALTRLDAKLPGINGKTAVGGNRYMEPSAKRIKITSSMSADERRDAKEKQTTFPIKDRYKADDAPGIPVLDGCGNLLGVLSPAACNKGVAINFGQIKKMPKFDLSKDRTKPDFRKADPSRPSIQYVFAFATRMIVDEACFPLLPDLSTAATLPVPDRAKKLAEMETLLGTVSKLRKLLGGNDADALTKELTRLQERYARLKRKSISISAWIPMSALKSNPKRARLFRCTCKCMSPVENQRRRKGKTTPMRIADLHQLKWTRKEWFSAGSAKKKGAAKRMVSESISRLLDDDRDELKPKRMFPNGFIIPSDEEGFVRDYLARNAALPSALRCVNFQFAIPGAGGVASDTFPVGTRFHRLSRHPRYHKQTRIYRNEKPTSKKISWYYGYVEYPEGSKKTRSGKRRTSTGRRYGWLLKNALTTG